MRGRATPQGLMTKHQRMRARRLGKIKELEQDKKLRQRMLVERDPDANERKRKPGSGTLKFTPERAKAFCATLADTANVTKSAATIGCSRITLYQWRERYPAFAKAWDAALKIGLNALEDEAVRRGGVAGVQEPVFYKGDIVGSITKHSDTLLTFLLSAHKPEMYGKNRTELTGKDGVPLMPIKVEVEFVGAGKT